MCVGLARANDVLVLIPHGGRKLFVPLQIDKAKGWTAQSQLRRALCKG